MPAIDASRFEDWEDKSGVYSIHNADTLQVLDQEDIEPPRIHCCDGEPDLHITNPSQLWWFCHTRPEIFIVANERNGAYLAAPDADCSVQPQTGNLGSLKPLWRIEPAPGHEKGVYLTSVKHAGHVLEVVDAPSGGEKIVKIGLQRPNEARQVWYLKRHDG